MYLNKVKFYYIEEYDIKDVEVLDNKYILLEYFLSQNRNNLQNVIDDFLAVYNEAKTFEEIHDPDMTWPIEGDSGEFEFNKDSAYFISYNPIEESSFEIPLKELIDLFEKYKSFLIS